MGLCSGLIAHFLLDIGNERQWENDVMIMKPNHSQWTIKCFRAYVSSGKGTMSLKKIFKRFSAGRWNVPALYKQNTWDDFLLVCDLIFFFFFQECFYISVWSRNHYPYPWFLCANWTERRYVWYWYPQDQ